MAYEELELIVGEEGTFWDAVAEEEGRGTADAARADSRDGVRVGSRSEPDHTSHSAHTCTASVGLPALLQFECGSGRFT